MSKNDGNPAFPAPEAGIARFGDGNADAFMGMSLRDYFAAKAMASLTPVYWEDFESYGSGAELIKCQIETAY